MNIPILRVVTAIAAVAIILMLNPRPAASQEGAACRVDTPGAHLDALYVEWRRLLSMRAEIGEERFRHEALALIDDAFAVGDLSVRGMGSSSWWARSEYDQDRVRRAMRRAIYHTIMPAFDRSPRDVPWLRPAPEDWERKGDSTSRRFWLVADGWQEWFTLELVAERGACRIADVKRGGESLAGTLRKRMRDALESYSFPYMVAVLGDYDEIVFDDFEDDEPGTLPKGWSWRDEDDNTNKPYRVRAENGNQYLEATDEGESVILGREQGWNLNEYPYVSFRVRVNRIPEGGDERDDDKVDSAAGLYFTLNKKFLGKIPESVKYVWSSTLPVGTAVRRDGIGKPWQVVFGTGKEGLGEWRTYIFDVRQAYRDTFGEDPPRRAIGVGILSDANSLDAQAWADYDDIKALRTAPEGVGTGVIEIVKEVNR
ncbi:MAG: DUF3047 domain-containing protein [Longimicrobiales bacterium]|nr:DUF3047 domain-containing protein [Longimicrobiales bacterium]